ncbi:hypothetical protein [Rhodopirellula baltica]|uniref:hypothetical protein n=1 Tax=Rhodopirellula baltica TaxID=265606 RepID=UPI000566A9DE|nr:hypothetical protein [Rhodopirellula baltica]
MFTRNASLLALKSLGVADVFTRCFDSKALPHSLDVHFGPPDELFTASGNCEFGPLIPLLDDGSFRSVLFLDIMNRRQLHKRYVDDLRVDAIVYQGWQQYLADLTISIADSGASDEELSAIAKTIGFDHPDSTLTFLDAASDVPWEQRHFEFIGAI